MSQQKKTNNQGEKEREGTGTPTDTEQQKKPNSAQSRPAQAQPTRSFYDSTMPQQIHCRQCKTLMENGVCPTCGYKMYVPMDPKKRDKIRLILTGIFIAAFVVIFVALQIARG